MCLKHFVGNACGLLKTFRRKRFCGLLKTFRRDPFSSLDFVSGDCRLPCVALPMSAVETSIVRLACLEGAAISDQRSRVEMWSLLHGCSVESAVEHMHLAYIWGQATCDDEDPPPVAVAVPPPGLVWSNVSVPPPGLVWSNALFANDMRAQVPKTSGCNRILWDSFTTACDFESIEPVLCDVLLSHGIGYIGVVHRGSEGRPVLC